MAELDGNSTSEQVLIQKKIFCRVCDSSDNEEVVSTRWDQDDSVEKALSQVAQCKCKV